MRCAQRVSCVAGLVVALFAVAGVARADAIVLRDAKVYGRIASVSQTHVTITEGCNGSSRTIAWSEIQYVEVNDQCGGTQVWASRSGATGCARGDPVVAILAIEFVQSEGAAPFVRAVKLEYGGADDAIITLPGDRNALVGPFRSIVMVEPTITCQSSLASERTRQLPPGFARKP